MYRMMLVDDDYISREGLRDLINWGAMGIEVAGEAEDGEEALGKFDQLRPEIIITDVVMPGMNGIAFARAIKQKAPDTQIIMISAHQDIQYIKESMKCDAVDYILKPFNIEEIRQAVSRVIDRIEKEGQTGKFMRDLDRNFRQSIMSEESAGLTEMKERIPELCGIGRTEELKTEITGFFQKIRENKLESTLFLTSVCSDMLIKAMKNVCPGQRTQAAEEIRKQLEGFDSMKIKNEIEKYVTHELLCLDDYANVSQADKSRKVVREVKWIIQDEFGRNITIAQLAQRAFLSPGRLQTIFKQETGKTINDYISEVRVEKAREMLRDPHVKIYEVAGRVGYQDTNYFTKIFTKLVNKSPIEYRDGLI